MTKIHLCVIKWDTFVLACNLEKQDKKSSIYTHAVTCKRCLKSKDYEKVKNRILGEYIRDIWE